MELNEMHIGATFSFDPKSEASINEQIHTKYSWHTDITKLLMVPGSKWRLMSPPQNEGNFRLELVGGNGYQPPVTSVHKLSRMKVREVESPKDIKDLPAREAFSTSCDPELFLENGNGDIIPAFEVLPDVENKIEMEEDDNYPSNLRSAFYADGFGAEFSPAPYQCHAVVNHRMSKIIKHILKHVRKTHKDASISPKNFVEISPEIMAKGTDAQVALGCQPSENIYGTPNFSPGDSRAFPYRMVGGHIHLGDRLIAPWLHKRAEPIIRALDAFCGVPTVAMFDGIDDTRRRQYYGRAGEFRFQPHGLEYRALSNAWLSSPMFSHLVMNLARASFRLGFLNWQEIHKVDAMRVQYIIDHYDVKEARKFVEEYKPLLKFLMDKDGGAHYNTDLAFKLFEVGVKAALPNWDDFEGNWSKHKSVGTEENGGTGAVSTWRFGSERVLFKTKEELKKLEEPIQVPFFGNAQLAAWAQAANVPGQIIEVPHAGDFQMLANVPQADENRQRVPMIRFERNEVRRENVVQRAARLAAEREAEMRQHQQDLQAAEVGRMNDEMDAMNFPVPAPERVFGWGIPGNQAVPVPAFAVAQETDTELVFTRHHPVAARTRQLLRENPTPIRLGDEIRHRVRNAPVRVPTPRDLETLRRVNEADPNADPGQRRRANGAA